MIYLIMFILFVDVVFCLVMIDENRKYERTKLA